MCLNNLLSKIYIVSNNASHKEKLLHELRILLYFVRSYKDIIICILDKILLFAPYSYTSKGSIILLVRALEMQSQEITS